MNFREYKRSAKVGDVLEVQGNGTLLLVGDVLPCGITSRSQNSNDLVEISDDTDVAVIENTFSARLSASVSDARLREILTTLGFKQNDDHRHLFVFDKGESLVFIDLSSLRTYEDRAMMLADVFDVVTAIPDDLKIEVARVRRIWTPKRGAAALEQIGFKRVPDQHRMHHLVADLFFDLSALDGRTSNEIEDEVLSAARCILTRGALHPHPRRVIVLP